MLGRWRTSSTPIRSSAVSCVSLSDLSLYSVPSAVLVRVWSSSLLTIVHGEKRCLWEIGWARDESDDRLGVLGALVLGIRSAGSKKYSIFSLPVIYRYALECKGMMKFVISKGYFIWKFYFKNIHVQQSNKRTYQIDSLGRFTLRRLKVAHFVFQESTSL